MSRCVLTLIALALAAACTHGGKGTNRPLRLTVFTCGDIVVRDVSIFSPGFGKGQEKHLTNSCYLIDHPKGKMIWDSGFSADLAEKKDGTDAMDGAFHLSLKKPLVDQLKSVDVDPEEIAYIAFSHFHFDHIGGGTAYPNASVLVQTEEYASAFGPQAEKSGIPAAFADYLKKAKVVQLHGDLDVFGDGTVVIKRMIGHTPGHQSLYLHLAKKGPILLTGDLYHFTKNRMYRRVPSFNFSKPETEKSMAAFEAFAKEKNAEVWIQHDLEQNQQILHAPDFYE